MNKKYIIFCTLVISCLMLGSMISIPSINAETLVGNLDVEKKVWNGSDWVNSISAEQGDVVQFKITISYYNETPGHHYAYNIVVNDLLPDGFDYVTGSATPNEPNSEVGYPGGNTYQWVLDSVKLYDGESYVITFNATVQDCGELINRVETYCDEYCTGYQLTAYDTATVDVECDPVEPPMIDVEKWVWDGYCEWVNEIHVYPQTLVNFRILVKNTGGTVLHNITIVDTLSDSLQYSYRSDPPPDEITDNGSTLIWRIQTLDIDEEFEIVFEALVIGDPCDEDVNWVHVIGYGECDQIVEDQDDARVLINGMCMNKQVWNDETDEWAEEATIGEGEKARFRITVCYFGDYKLYNIRIWDQLPGCLVYGNEATLDGDPYEPDVDGQTLWWNLTDYILLDGECLVIEFDVFAGENNCQPCINWAHIIANECSGNIFEEEDSATLYIDCAFIADAGGPYYSDIDESISITGSATGGALPYSYAWDMDDDGQYDDATGATTTWSWSESGCFIINLKVTDDDGEEAYDYAYVNIATPENNPPNKPSKPQGSTSGSPGVEYSYTTSTTDPDGDDVMYMFDWGDGTTSGWLGPYDSGETIEAKHTWSTRGSYQVKVKAKDMPHFEDSEWSDSLGVSMPRSRSSFLFNNPIIVKLFERLFGMFPILQHLL